jgi:hypothetical protein
MNEVQRILTTIDHVGIYSDMEMGPFSVFQGYTHSLLACEDQTSPQSLVQRDEFSPLLLSDFSPSASFSSALSDEFEDTPLLPPVIVMYHRWPLAAKLIHHYITNVTGLLQPVVHPLNFYSMIYVPQAIIGAGCLFGPGMIGTQDTSPPCSNKAIFYSLLATAAFHLRGIKTRVGYQSEEMDNAGRTFRIMAYSNLRMAMSTVLEKREELQTTMSAVLSFITIDVSFSRAPV